MSKELGTFIFLAFTVVWAATLIKMFGQDPKPPKKVEEEEFEVRGKILPFRERQ